VPFLLKFLCGYSRIVQSKAHPSAPSADPKVVDPWNKKRALFRVYDNIGILGNFEKHPKELII
jgi:hypothetical protein